jgi:hypothetical protein
VPALINVLSDPDSSVQGSAAYALGQLKEEARPAVPELQRLMNGTDARLARAASNALYQIDPSTLGWRAVKGAPSFCPSGAACRKNERRPREPYSDFQSR